MKNRLRGVAGPSTSIGTGIARFVDAFGNEIEGSSGTITDNGEVTFNAENVDSEDAVRSRDLLQQDIVRMSTVRPDLAVGSAETVQILVNGNNAFPGSGNQVSNVRVRAKLGETGIQTGRWRGVDVLLVATGAVEHTGLDGNQIRAQNNSVAWNSTLECKEIAGTQNFIGCGGGAGVISGKVVLAMGNRTKVGFNPSDGGSIGIGIGSRFESPKGTDVNHTIDFNFGGYFQDQGDGGVGVGESWAIYMEDQSGHAIQTNAGTVQFGDQVICDKDMVWSPGPLQSLDAADTIQPDTSLVPIEGNGAPVVLTSNPQIAAGTAGKLLLLAGRDDTNTLEINPGNGLHIHGKAIFGKKDMMFLHYNEDDSEWHEISRNFAISNPSWPFTSPAGATGVFHYDGFYEFGATDNDFNPTINFGTANSARGAHLFLVQAAGGSGGTDTVVRITGTSITDSGVRTAPDTEDITVDDAGSAGTYYETTKKWIGQVSIVKISGPDLLMNYGFCKYWDNNNTDFRVLGVNVTWLGGANDTGANLILRHHKSTGWTYNAGAPATPPVVIADMQTDYVTEKDIVNGESGAWKRTDLNVAVSGGDSEGLIMEIVTSANKAFELGNFQITIRPN